MTIPPSRKTMRYGRMRAVERLSLRTDRREQFLDITEEIAAAVASLAIEAGAVLVHVPHTTAAVTVNEGYDPDVASDVLQTLHLEGAVTTGSRGRRLRARGR